MKRSPKTEAKTKAVLAYSRLARSIPAMQREALAALAYDNLIAKFSTKQFLELASLLDGIERAAR